MNGGGRNELEQANIFLVHTHLQPRTSSL